MLSLNAVHGPLSLSSYLGEETNARFRTAKINHVMKVNKSRNFEVDLVASKLVYRYTAPHQEVQVEKYLRGWNDDILESVPVPNFAPQITTVWWLNNLCSCSENFPLLAKQGPISIGNEVEFLCDRHGFIQFADISSRTATVSKDISPIIENQICNDENLFTQHQASKHDAEQYLERTITEYVFSATGGAESIKERSTHMPVKLNCASLILSASPTTSSEHLLDSYSLGCCPLLPHSTILCSGNGTSAVFSFELTPSMPSLLFEGRVPIADLLPEISSLSGHHGIIHTGGDYSIVLADAASDASSGKRRATGAVVSAAVLLQQHGLKSAIFVHHATAPAQSAVLHDSVCNINSNSNHCYGSYLARLTDLQSPWTLLPYPASTRRRTTAPAPRTPYLASPIIAQCIATLVQHGRLQVSRKRTLACLSTSQEVNMSNLGNLPEDRELRPSHKKRRKEKNRRVDALSAFVSTAATACNADFAHDERAYSSHPLPPAEAAPLEPSREAPPEAIHDVVSTSVSPPMRLPVPPTPPAAKPAVPRRPEPPSGKTASSAPVPQDHQQQPRVVAPKANTATAPPPSFTMPQFELPALQGESLLDQYLRLQRGEPMAAGAAVAAAGGSHGHLSTATQVTPPMGFRGGKFAGVGASASASAADRRAQPLQAVAAVSPASAPAPLDALQSRIAQLAQHNLGAHHQRGGSDAFPVSLVVLIAEEMLDTHTRAVGELERTHGVQCVDAALQSPVSVIVDATSAICLVPSTVLLDKAELRGFVKQLTRVTFKFSRISIVITLPGSGGASGGASGSVELNSALLTLTQALVRFPARMLLHQCADTPAAVASMVALIGRQCVAHALEDGGGDTMHAYHARSFLEQLRSADAWVATHCEFLQRLPTVNYFLAAWLLHQYSLRELVDQELPALCAALRRAHPLTEAVEACLRVLVHTLRVHVGLVAGQEF